MLIRTFLAPDDGQGGGIPAPTLDDAAFAAEAEAPTQSEPQAPEAEAAQPEVGQAPEQAPFFEIEDEKGKPYRWNSPDELKSSFKNMAMLRGDYSRKTQELSQQRKQFEQEMAQKQKESEEQQARIQKYNEFLEKNPQVMRQLEQSVRQGVPPHMAMQQAQSYADKRAQELEKRLEELEGQLQQQSSQRQREELFAQMKSQYEDFDEESVNELLQVLNAGDPAKLIETLHYASLGRKPPTERMRRMAQQIEAKQQGGLVPGRGNRVDSRKGFSSLDEAEAAALNEQ